MPVTDLPGYYPTVKDGGLGVLPPSTAGLFAVVGVARKGATTIKFAADGNDILDEYDMGTLVEQAADAFNNGATQIGLKRCLAQTAGSVSATVTHKIYGDPVGGGGGAIVAADLNSGVTNPYNDRSFVIRITKAGSFDTAEFKLSTNGGLTFGPAQRFPITKATASRESEIDMGNGTYVKFTEAATPANSFVAGDEYRWITTEAKALSTDIENTVEDVMDWTDPNGGQGFEYVYVTCYPALTKTSKETVKTSIESFWTALMTKAENLWTAESRPIWVIVDVPSLAETKPDDEDVWGLDEWIAMLVEMSGHWTRKKRLCVNAGFALLTGRGGEILVRPSGGCLSGLASGAKLHHSIAFVRDMALTGAVRVEPYHPVEAVKDEPLGTGDASQVTFTGFLDNVPVVPWSVVITSDDLTPEEFVDGGDGKLYDSPTGAAAGTIDYETGEFSVTFAIAPAVSKTVSGSYSWMTAAEVTSKANMAQLNDARYVSMRLWQGYGIRFTDDWLMAPATSDYYCIRNRRIMDEAVRQVGIANMPWVNSPGITEDIMGAYTADLSRPLEAMKVTAEDSDQPIMDYKLTLTPDENIWSNGIVHAKIEIVPSPTKKKLDATFILKTKIEE